MGDRPDAWHISKYGKVLLPQECYYIVSAAFLHDIHAHQEAENSSKKAPSKSQDLEQKFLPRVHRQAFHAFSVALETGACVSFPYAFVTLRVSLLAFSDHLPQSAGSSRTPCRKKRRHQQDRRRNRDNISYSALLWAVFGIHAGFHDPLMDDTIIPQRLFRVIGANPAI